jgi:hypothetical protein
MPLTVERTAERQPRELVIIDQQDADHFIAPACQAVRRHLDLMDGGETRPE